MKFAPQVRRRARGIRPLRTSGNGTHKDSDPMIVSVSILIYLAQSYFQSEPIYVNAIKCGGLDGRASPYLSPLCSSLRIV